MDNTLLHHAAGFVVRTQGNWTDGALAQFRHFLKLRHLEPDTEELAQAPRASQARIFLWKPATLCLCGAALL
jgi:hypothetical protein